jgi:uncharacterized coiled-coil DUF342 family protein
MKHAGRVLALATTLVLTVILLSSCNAYRKEFDAKLADFEGRIKAFEEKVDSGFYRDEKVEVVMQYHGDTQELFKETMDFYNKYAKLGTNKDKKRSLSKKQDELLSAQIERIRAVTHYLDSLSASKLRELGVVM